MPSDKTQLKYFHGSPISGSSYLPTCSAFLSAFPFSAMTSQIQSGVQHPRPGVLKAELVWRFWENPIPLLCMVYQDVLIDIVPQLGISTVFGQIHLSITPHIHEFSRAHLGFKKNVFKNWWLRLQNWFWFPPSIPIFFRRFCPYRPKRLTQPPHLVICCRNLMKSPHVWIKPLPSPTGLWSSSLRLGVPHLALSAQSASSR